MSTAPKGNLNLLAALAGFGSLIPPGALNISPDKQVPASAKLAAIEAAHSKRMRKQQKRAKATE